MIDRADELLRAVIARPEDDAPRLVLADRWMERGDPRGEFIQIQCALGRRIEGATGRVPDAPQVTEADWGWLDRAAFLRLDPPNRAALEAREATLYRKHVKHWLEPVRPYFRTWSWRRGFLDHVTAPGAAFFDGAAALLAAHPVAVSLEKMDRAAFDRLSRAPLEGLRALAVPNVEATVVDALLGENLRSLETLALGSALLGAAAVARLATESHLHGLRRLELCGVDLGDDGLRAIVSSPIFAGLRALDLRWTGITTAGLRDLVESPRLPRLTHVRILEDFFTDETVAALARRCSHARRKAAEGIESDRGIE